MIRIKINSILTRGGKYVTENVIPVIQDKIKGPRTKIKNHKIQ
ncbi:TPA: hypothetical protein MCA61_000698 [Klebsiella pneumoniae]|nr:hypothetical protein [Klebsiella pneumoniae]HBT5779074.1 hypothetical protein [Klebsiella pneumoniae]HBU3839762.1 hypothetical protein [Klebsiella pneumoniae]